MNRYANPMKPVKIAIYLNVETSSSFRRNFIQIIVNIGAELIIRVTRPEDMCCSAKIRDQPTRNIDTKPVNDASLNNFALNFSRFPIPEPKSFDVEKWFVMNKFYKHIGIYGYRAKVLQEICKLQPTKKELSEKLEQLRWLENGYKIKVGITAFESISIDVPKDIEKLNL